MRERLNNLGEVIKLTISEWSSDNAPRLAAALAYYTIFSLAPLLLLVISIAGLVWDTQSVRESILNQVGGLMGSGGVEFIGGMLNRTGNVEQNLMATIIGTITLVLGALGVFNELKNSLNVIWDVKEKKTKGFVATIKKIIFERLLSFAMVVGIGFLLLVSLVLSTAINAAQKYVSGIFEFPPVLLEIVNTIFSLAVISLMFAFIFKYLPDAKIRWRDVWFGAVVTSVLFTLGKTLIGIYLGNSSVGSAFGAAGSLILILLWVYYSAQILFFGAEFTQVYANKFGKKIKSE